MDKDWAKDMERKARIESARKDAKAIRDKRYRLRKKLVAGTATEADLDWLATHGARVPGDFAPAVDRSVPEVSPLALVEAEDYLMGTSHLRVPAVSAILQRGLEAAGFRVETLDRCDLEVYQAHPIGKCPDPPTCPQHRSYQELEDLPPKRAGMNRDAGTFTMSRYIGPEPKASVRPLTAEESATVERQLEYIKRNTYGSPHTYGPEVITLPSPQAKAWSGRLGPGTSEDVVHSAEHGADCNGQPGPIADAEDLGLVNCPECLQWRRLAVWLTLSIDERKAKAKAMLERYMEAHEEMGLTLDRVAVEAMVQTLSADLPEGKVKCDIRITDGKGYVDSVEIIPEPAPDTRFIVGVKSRERVLVVIHNSRGMYKPSTVAKVPEGWSIYATKKREEAARVLRYMKARTSARVEVLNISDLGEIMELECIDANN